MKMTQANKAFTSLSLNLVIPLLCNKIYQIEFVSSRSSYHPFQKFFFFSDYFFPRSKILLLYPEAITTCLEYNSWLRASKHPIINYLQLEGTHRNSKILTSVCCFFSNIFFCHSFIHSQGSEIPTRRGTTRDTKDTRVSLSTRDHRPGDLATMKGNKTMSTVDNCAKQTMEQVDAGWPDKIYFKWVLDRLPWEGALQPNAESEREKGVCQDLGTGIADRNGPARRAHSWS